MENKTKYILIVIVLVLVGAVFTYQQKKIMDLNGRIDNLDTTNTENQLSATGDPFLAGAVQKTIKENTKELKGSVVSKDQGSITIDADVVNFSKLSGLTDAALKQTESLPTLKKKFTIAVNADTEFPLKLDGIRIGSRVDIFTDNLVYGDEQLTAKKVWVIPGANEKASSPEDFLKTVDKVGGSIKEIGSNFFVVEVQWIDVSRDGSFKNIDPATAPKITKTYKVLIGDNTVFSKSGKKDLKIGDQIDAFAGKPVFSLTEFTATKIEGPLSPPSL